MDWFTYLHTRTHIHRPSDFSVKHELYSSLHVQRLCCGGWPRHSVLYIYTCGTQCTLQSHSLYSLRVGLHPSLPIVYLSKWNKTGEIFLFSMNSHPFVTFPTKYFKCHLEVQHSQKTTTGLVKTFSHHISRHTADTCYMYTEVDISKCNSKVG